jgi:hypothetical protein
MTAKDDVATHSSLLGHLLRELPDVVTYALCRYPRARGKIRKPMGAARAIDPNHGAKRSALHGLVRQQSR